MTPASSNRLIKPRQGVEELQRAVGEAVARARKRNRMTQQRLARLMRTRQANISRIERGMQNLSLNLLIRLDRALKMGLNISVRRG